MTYERAIARGIEFLDANEPGWRAKVNWESLDMDGLRNDIGGQLDGNGNSFAWFYDHDIGHAIAVWLGFDLPYTEGNYATLTAEWKVAVNG